MKDFLVFLEKIKKKNSKLRLSYLIVIFFFLLACFCVLLAINISFQEKIKTNNLFPPSFSYPLQDAYPQVQREDAFDLVSAQAYIVMDNSSKIILFEKNPHLRFSMASTTKIMTALTSLSYFKLDDILTVYNEKVEGVKIGLISGEKMTFKNMLYGMLLPSGNDAAVTIAQNYPGGVDRFVEQMNIQISKLYFSNTHFVDPTGLDERDYTTAWELARLAGLAINNQTIASIVSTKEKVISNIDNTRSYSILNLNKLLGKKGVNGIKTGYTEEAGEVLITSKIENGHTIIIVVMKSQDRFGDTEKLLSLIDGKVMYTKFGY